MNDTTNNGAGQVKLVKAIDMFQAETAQNPVDFTQIPEALRERSQWVVWALESRKGSNPCKVPYNPRTGRKADATNSRTWAGFAEATGALQAKPDGWAGIGYVFSPDDNFCGIDLDNCRNRETGEIETWAATVIASLDSYSEISPSGTGVKIFVRAKKPEGSNRKGNVEIYDCERYFTVTGRILEDASPDVESRQAELEAFYTAHFGPVCVAESTGVVSVYQGEIQDEIQGSNLEDGQILSIARNAANGAKFCALFDEGRGEGGESENTLSLLNILAFYTRDRAKIDRLFRASKLMRPKWDERRGNTTWGDQQIEKALSDTKKTRASTKQIRVKSQSSLTAPKPTDPSPAKMQASLQDLASTCLERLQAQDTHLVFLPQGSRWFQYQEGVYKYFELVQLDRLVDTICVQAGHTDLSFFKRQDVIRKLSFSSRIWREQSEPNKYEICVQDGILNLETGILFPHGPEHFHTAQAGAEFGADAKGTAWLKFLEQAVPSASDRLALAQFAGLCLTGEMRFQKALLLVGKAGSGKGVFSRALERLLGGTDDTGLASALDLTDLQGSRLEKIVGKRLVTISEIPKRTDWLPFKRLTGGDKMLSDPKYRAAHNFHPVAKVMILSNILPHLGEDSANDSITRRLLTVRFDHVATSEERALNIEQGLETPEEMSGILAWALNGLRNLLEAGDFAQTSNDVNSQIKRGSNRVIDFLEETHEHSESDVDQIGSSDLYGRYKNWALGEGHNPVASNRFSDDMLDALEFLGWTGKKRVTKSGKYWTNIMKIGDSASGPGKPGGARMSVMH